MGLAIVRFVALAALVVWIAALAAALAGDALRHLHVVSAACGAVLFLALVAMKFIGPPPRAFPARAGIVIVMLGATGYTLFWRAGSTAAIAATAALGFVLLAWYARE